MRRAFACRAKRPEQRRVRLEAGVDLNHLTLPALKPLGDKPVLPAGFDAVCVARIRNIPPDASMRCALIQRLSFDSSEAITSPSRRAGARGRASSATR